MEGIGGDELDDVDTKKFSVIEKNGNNYGFYFTVNYDKLNESDETIIDLYPTDGCVDNEGSECGDVNGVESNNNYEYSYTLNKNSAPLKENEVVGQYRMRIRWIGWPTVKLNEWLVGGE